MKKHILLTACLLASLHSYSQEVFTLDLESTDYEYFEDKQYWTETYNIHENVLSFNDGMFNFSHIPGLFGGTDVGGGMSYWDGFTICRSGDTTDYGTVGNSDGWVPQQWGCMAGGGLNADFQTEQGKPYLVAYWGYYYEKEGIHSCQVDFDGNPHRVKGVYICNHPWPYYGNIHGDGFASAFTEPSDYFTITAHGMLNGEDTGSEVTMTLAENLGDGIVHKSGWPKGLVQSDRWQWMDLQELGEVDAVYFTMDTSDADPIYGANTAVYFCLDKMQIYEYAESAIPQRPSGLAASDIKEESLQLTWNAQSDATSYDVFVNNALMQNVTTNTCTISHLSPYTSYTLKVIAKNDCGDSDPASITAKTVDTTAPSAPVNIKATVINAYTAQLSWDASADNVAVTRYVIYKNGVKEARPKTNTYKLTGLDPCTRYLIEIEATDASGNVSAKSSITFITPKSSNSIDGDANNDGKLDKQDTENLADILTGKIKTNSMLADMDGDGIITIKDLTILINKLK